MAERRTFRVLLLLHCAAYSAHAFTNQAPRKLQRPLLTTSRSSVIEDDLQIGTSVTELYGPPKIVSACPSTVAGETIVSLSAPAGHYDVESERLRLIEAMQIGTGIGQLYGPAVGSKRQPLPSELAVPGPETITRSKANRMSQIKKFAGSRMKSLNKLTGKSVRNIGTVASKSASQVSAVAGKSAAGLHTLAGDSINTINTVAGQSANSIGKFAEQSASNVSKFAGQTAHNIGKFAGQSADSIGKFAGHSATSINKFAGHSVNTMHTLADNSISGVNHLATKQVPAVYNKVKNSEVWDKLNPNPYVEKALEHPTTKKLQENKYFRTTSTGLVTALAMAPEALTFGYVAGVSPLVGLWTTVTMGLVAAALGGTPGMFSSASGACAVVVSSLCAAQGPAYVSLCAILAGVFQIAAGKLQLDKLIRMIPSPAMLGFCNGLAILMARAQLVHFRGIKALSLPGISTYAITGLTLYLLRALSKMAISKVIPPAMGALASVTILSSILRLPVATLSDISGASVFAGGLGTLPKLSLPALPASLATLKVVLPYALTMAAVGCIATLKTVDAVHDKMGSDASSCLSEKECVAQGAANVVSGLFGGIGGSPVMRQTVGNVQAGGDASSRLSGMSMALFVALGTLLGAPVLGAVPVAGLAGMVFHFCRTTFTLSPPRDLSKYPVYDAFVIALTTIVSVKRDLGTALVAGTIASSLGFAYKQAKRFTTSKSTAVDKEYEERVYRMKGPLYFASASAFASVFDTANDPGTVIIDFAESDITDLSALEAIHAVGEKYASEGKQLVLRHVSEDSKQVLEYSANPAPFVVEERST